MAPKIGTTSVIYRDNGQHTVSIGPVGPDVATSWFVESLGIFPFQSVP